VTGGEPQASLRAYDVTDGYFDTWQVRLSQGRWFSADEYRSEAQVAIVDAVMAKRLWPSGNALGHELRVGNDPPRRVIGVVATQVRSLRNPPTGEAYIPRIRPAQWLPLAAWAPGIPASALERRIEPIISAILSAPVVRAEPVTKTWLFNRQTGEAEFQGPIMGAFALLTFVLSGVGIFGLVSYLIAQRTREFAIRVALGASNRNICRIVLLESLVPSVVGLLAGVVAARLLESYVRSSVFGLDPIRWTSFQRGIRCPNRWPTLPSDDPVDSSRMNSKPAPCAWSSMKARRSAPPRGIWT
jgi:hypothetical protein